MDTTGKVANLLVGSIPEATSGVTASHIFAVMLEVEKKLLTTMCPLWDIAQIQH